VSVSHDTIKRKFESIKNLNGISNIRGLRLNSYDYKSLNELKNYSSLEYFNFWGKTDEVIPFSELNSLWRVYLNYDKKTCSSIFQNKNIEYLFIENYSGDSSEEFNILTESKRIGLVKTKILEFESLKYMPSLEHLVLVIISERLLKPMDEKGNRIWSTELDIYGRVKEFTGEKDFIPFRYQGQYEDVEIGLYYNRFRFYDPEQENYTQIVPIGLVGGNPSLYGYVKDPKYLVRCLWNGTLEKWRI